MGKLQLVWLIWITKPEGMEIRSLCFRQRGEPKWEYVQHVTDIACRLAVVHLFLLKPERLLCGYGRTPLRKTKTEKFNKEIYTTESCWMGQLFNTQKSSQRRRQEALVGLCLKYRKNV